MLTHLHIENYALIRQSDIDFADGFVAITGETGAGKSILLGALSLLLGQRADTKILLDTSHKCIVEAQFKTNGIDLSTLFQENDVDYDDSMVIIRREILPNAKSRTFVNDTPVALAFLKELGSRLFDIHSQHANLLLADKGFQTALLDCIAANQTLLNDYRQCYASYIDLKYKLEKLTAEDQQMRKDYDYNQFLFDELYAAALGENEQEQLEQESSLLANAENIKQSLSQSVALTDGEEDSTLSRLNATKTLLGKISSLDPQLNTLYERVESCMIELRDITAELTDMNERIVFSPERQEQVDQRLDLIYRLQKKHGVTSIHELLEIQEQLEQKLTRASDTDRTIKEIMEAVDKAFKEMQKTAATLSESRRQAAQLLPIQINPLLADLGMPHATIEASIQPAMKYGPLGIDNVTLLFNANKGGQPRELSKVASGGEMSRLMLAVKALTVRAGLLPTVIFDEIDTGISGDVSVKMSRIMQRMSEEMQVIAITHLPQIAARASQHYKVYKSDQSDGTTASNIRMLSSDERITELAVMLSSDPPTPSAIQTAKELMLL